MTVNVLGGCQSKGPVEISSRRAFHGRERFETETVARPGESDAHATDRAVLSDMCN